MTQEIEDFDWDGISETAAQLLATGQLTEEQIAGRLEISRSTVTRWKRHPEFKTRVDEHIAEIREEVKRVGLADLYRRVEALNDRWRAMLRVIDERAADPTMADVPGGTTGLLVRTTKALGSGKSARVIHEYAVDTALLRELREHEKQAAQELGQWTTKVAPTNPAGDEEFGSGMTDADRTARIEQLLGNAARRSSEAGGRAGEPTGTDVSGNLKAYDVVNSPDGL
jgi:ParB-like chromosome segregation protein Spo0J